MKKIIPWLIIALSLYIGYVGWSNRQEIVDQVKVAQISVDPEITQLVVDSGMNDRGVFIYHATDPRLESQAGFNEACNNSEQGTAILGCYVNDTVHIYDIQDERLEGIREVTATHEALHAVYARTSESDKLMLEPLLEAEYNRLVTDNPELVNRMEYYARTQPGQRANELFSIVGTEFDGLSDKLEEYYSKYFDDRSKVVALHQQYEAKFKEYRTEIDTKGAELNELSKSIDQASTQYNNDIDALNSWVSDFNNRADSGYFESQSQFNTERSQLLAEAARLESARESLNNKISLYEQKRLEYNAIVDESNSMYESLDSSRPEAAPQI